MLYRTAQEYRPFPNLPLKNAVHVAFEVPAAVRALHLPPGGRILELGCGRGFALLALAYACRPARLVGAEIDAVAAAEACERLASAGVQSEVVVADVRSLPFADGTFDAVVDFGTCYHVARAEDALAEVARVLEPGGVFLHETRASQLVAHPIRGLRGALPWRAEPSLVPAETALLWATRRRVPATSGEHVSR